MERWGREDQVNAFSKTQSLEKMQAAHLECLKDERERRPKVEVRARSFHFEDTISLSFLNIACFQGTLPIEAQENTLYLTAFAVIGIRKAFDLCPLMVSKSFLSPTPII